ncbi:MAG: hypothetical protein RLZZ394_271, partial [Actinomycetota bacterium]
MKSLHDEVRVREARLQLFDISTPGEKRLAKLITELGIVESRDRLHREC